MGAFVAAFVTPAAAAPLQKPDQIRGSCSGDDAYFPPDSSGAYGCLKKDGSGIVCGGWSDENKKTCETWSASGSPPSRAPGALRGATQKKAADKAVADKAKADKAAAEKAAADKAAADKAKASKPAVDKPTPDKSASDKPTSDKPSTSKPTSATSSSVHDCPGIKLNCGAWAPKDGNTCRSCQLAQCRIENGGEVVAGNKTQNQCYEGHGPPPKD
jgi:hypothetical protein